MGVRPDPELIFAPIALPCPYVIYCLSMDARSELAMAEFFNPSGELFSPALTSDWPRPNRVELHNGILTIWSTQAHQKSLEPNRLARPGRGLLESFLSLAGPADQQIPLSALMKGTRQEHFSDEKICRFAAHFGGLQIFYRMQTGSPWPEAVHTEYCAVWRYFAGVMRSLLLIGAEQYQGKPGSPEPWRVISTPPSLMGKMARKQDRCWFEPMPLGDEENWLALAYFAAKKNEQNQVMIARLLNTLLGLGRVRPWITWSGAQPEGPRPRFTYTSRSLLSHLALQLCLRISKVEAFVVCFHCGRTYLPPVRAPKAGQRNFCPDCREKGMPKYYSHRDYRRRKRRSAKAGTRE